MPLVIDRTKFDSIVEYGHHEANLHRYYRSHKARCDLGSKAYAEWFQRYWVVFCHHRWVQYLYGEREFPEFCQPRYHGRIQQDAAGRIWANGMELCPRSVAFVQRMFLREHCPWEMLTFVSNCREISQLGYDYHEVRKVLIEFGINECRLNWQDFFEVDECHVKDEYRRQFVMRP